MTDEIGAFVPGPRVHIEGRAGGPLSGLTFAAKDLFAVAGVATGGGNHDWPTGRAIPDRHAWAVQTLLDAGATLIGKTITDEVSLGILGENAFDGTPKNVRAPGRVPGGSSSGSAAAVAAGLCDTALGTDTGGSVRVPSSFCGLYGIRPTHGRVDVTGMLPQAPTSDTTGWFARDAETFAKVCGVMLGEEIPTALPSKLVVAVDAFGFADVDTSEALQPMVRKLAALVGSSREEIMAPQGLSVWARAQRSLQPAEAYATFRSWLDERNPRFAFSVAKALVAGSMIPESDKVWANLMRQEARSRMKYLLPAGTILCLPTTPFPAPKVGLPLSVLDPLRDRITCLCAQGGLAGFPQVNLPGATTVDGLPVGLSIIGPRGSDATLVAVARAMEKAAG
ncbi:amidase [Reyranella sp.]|jgi:amidase|uniref:amidase n=1 Tax=Reyranella sp. TaxID=1929291 RepID=UPI000BCE6432|nr:amidase [Reyranella sp.]OYY40077.1 MAG: glutamyl-tRNA amidotransferase [Rhodospirillales bacterium 35-66-84]OYZ92486.1 MAG: glutamyl-tRNA amidotransferase [Rhodospirillales bacterium 24-66-33]OZB23794.1 MAG: glutamyl-tRNA amidotransferase [Rhodospirillales bacterium 39-66-50]HQS17034.1 amidase [Reyranella sp.]HQT14995.1 amidase [Reyranella sp.]